MNTAIERAEMVLNFFERTNELERTAQIKGAGTTFHARLQPKTGSQENYRKHVRVKTFVFEGVQCRLICRIDKRGAIYQ